MSLILKHCLVLTENDSRIEKKETKRKGIIALHVLCMYLSSILMIGSEITNTSTPLNKSSTLKNIRKLNYSVHMIHKFLLPDILLSCLSSYIQQRCTADDGKLREK